MQLSQRCRARDIEDFFSAVGKISDIRLIMCNKTRRFKGIAYVEFKDVESVALALGLNGQKLLGIPLIVQPSQAEKNRVGQLAERQSQAAARGSTRLYVGGLHPNITDDMLRGIFEAFGKLQMLSLIKEQDTGRSKGYGFVTFYEADDAKMAMEQMNGFEIAGRPIKVTMVVDKQQDAYSGSLELEELDRAGIDLGTSGRLALMAKLAAGTGLKLPETAAQALSQTGMMSGGQAPSVASVAMAAHSAMMQQQQQQQATSSSPPIATQCFLLANMFDPATETSPTWDTEIRDDVIDECSRHGGVLHVYVDKFAPQGNVYVKCDCCNAAAASVNALHGRWFAGNDQFLFG
jgi:RNA-binding protein 39